MPDTSAFPFALARAVTEQSRHGLFATDERFRIVLWNRWMEEHSDRAAGDALGRPLFELYPEALERGAKEYYEMFTDPFQLHSRHDELGTASGSRAQRAWLVDRCMESKGYRRQ
mgnify:CR=1 FL=1